MTETGATWSMGGAALTDEAGAGEPESVTDAESADEQASDVHESAGEQPEGDAEDPETKATRREGLN